MSRLLLSAVLNTYNYGCFIEEAVESVLAQDCPASEMEILVVDDGSTDDTADRVRKFGSRVRYLYKPNGGQSSAVNLGFEHAQGGIVALLDADDVWLPGKARAVLEAFAANPSAVMVTHKRIVWDAATGAADEDEDLPVLSGAFPPTATDLLRHAASSTSALSFRANLVQPLLPIPKSLVLHADSYLIALSVLLAPVVALNQPLVRYRIHERNLFQFAKAEQERAQNRLRWLREFTREIKAWMSSHDFDLRDPALAAYAGRFDLIEQTYRFSAQGASRGEFYRHLRQHARVYEPLWTRRYRAYRMLLSLAGFILGYERFTGLRKRYRDSGAALRVRKELLPARSTEVALP